MAAIEIPQDVLAALERGEFATDPVLGADDVAVGTEDLNELAFGFNLEDASGLDGWIPDEADAERNEQRGPHVDESSKLYIGREFSLDEFAQWFKVQGLGTAPYNGIGIHHTWRPTGAQFNGAATVDAIFSYYHREYGWKLGKGPHLWLYGGDNPSYRPKQIRVVVGTHPAHDGIGITNRNHRWVHIESFGDWDRGRMVPGCVEGFRFLLKLLSSRRKQPVIINPGPSMSGPATWQGALFHRDAKTDIKSCPGTTTTHDWFDRAMLAKDETPTGDTAVVAEPAELRGGAGAATPLRATIAKGTTVRLLPQSGDPAWRRVRIDGYVRASSLVPPEEPKPVITPDATLLAAPRGTEAQILAYMLARPHGEYTEADVRLIVGYYFSTARDTGLDPFLAAVQMIHETGNLTSYWSQRPRRNPAGIGVTGVPGEGISFKDWATAVRAHEGRMLAYAVPAGSETAGQKPLVNEALAVRPLPASYRGVATTLAGLIGRWSVGDPHYALKLCRIGNAILERSPA